MQCLDTFIFASLILYKKHIALFFILVLGFTQLPFNAFHHHEEHEHFYVKNSSLEENHHCEIDDLFCETGYDHLCEHGSHIKAKHPDCFTCEFSFVKHFVQSVQPETNVFFQEPTHCIKGFDSQLFHYSIAFNNRGPPPFSRNTF